MKPLAGRQHSTQLSTQALASLKPARGGIRPPDPAPHSMGLTGIAPEARGGAPIMSIILFRATVSAVVAVSAFLALVSFQGRVSLGDLVLIGVASAIVTFAFASFARSPIQFSCAVYERAKYLIVVPFCVALVVGLTLFRVVFVLFKLSLKVFIWLFASVAYLVMPIDLIPDFLIGLGQLDDIILFFTLGFWIFSSALSNAARSTIEVSRPATPFP